MCAPLVACRSSQTESAVPEQLTIAFPEGTGISADRGAGQVARSLALEGLTQVGANGQVTKRLATEWKWVGERELRVTILPNITLHDGRKLNARLVGDILRPLLARPDVRESFPSFRDVVSLTAVGETGLVFSLARHSAWLPEDLSIPIEVQTKDKRLFGTGPYQIVETNAAGVSLTRFDKYHGGRPGIGRVFVKTENTLRTAWASLLRGDLEVVADLPPDTVELIRNENVRIIPFTRSYQFIIGLNLRLPKFADPRVRRALNMAIDRSVIVKNVLKGGGKPSNGPIWYGHWAADPAAAAMPHAPRRAEALLEDVGLRVLPSLNPRLPPARLRLTCLIPEGFIVYEHLALEVQRQLASVGVDLRFDVQQVETYNRRAREGDFEAVMVDIASGPGLSRSSIFWRSPKKPEVLRSFSYDNPRTEALFESLQTATSDTEVRSITRELQEALSENPPAIFLAWNERARTVRGDFDIEVEPGTDPLPRLWQWGARAPEGVATR
jgi:ABC-type transport system substrate-binding protein